VDFGDWVRTSGSEASSGGGTTMVALDRDAEPVGVLQPLPEGLSAGLADMGGWKISVNRAGGRIRRSGGAGRQRWTQRWEKERTRSILSNTIVPPLSHQYQCPLSTHNTSPYPPPLTPPLKCKCCGRFNTAKEAQLWVTAGITEAVWALLLFGFWDIGAGEEEERVEREGEGIMLHYVQQAHYCGYYFPQWE